jgi:hypothetical protein
MRSWPSDVNSNDARLGPPRLVVDHEGPHVIGKLLELMTTVEVASVLRVDRSTPAAGAAWVWVRARLGYLVAAISAQRRGRVAVTRRHMRIRKRRSGRFYAVPQIWTQLRCGPNLRHQARSTERLDATERALLASVQSRTTQRVRCKMIMSSEAATRPHELQKRPLMVHRLDKSHQRHKVSTTRLNGVFVVVWW